MRHRPALLVAIALLGALAATSSPTAESQTGKPSLRLVSGSPVTFRGAGFRAHEQVGLVVVGGARVVKHMLAGEAGGFVARVRGVDPNACPTFSASATGNLGSRASYKRAPGQCAVSP